MPWYVLCLFPGLVQGALGQKRRIFSGTGPVRQLMKHGHAHWTQGVLDVLELYWGNTDHNLH